MRYEPRRAMPPVPQEDPVNVLGRGCEVAAECVGLEVGMPVFDFIEGWHDHQRRPSSLGQGLPRQGEAPLPAGLRAKAMTCPLERINPNQAGKHSLVERVSE